MSAALSIASREFLAMFRLPAGWIVTALYLLISGLVFGLVVLDPGGPASLRAFFGVSGWLLLPVVPAVSMRLMSEELRSGTIEPLLTAPVSDWAVALGKYLGGALFLSAMLAPTLVYVGVLFAVADPAPDPGPIVAGYVTLLLTGLLYLAAGLFFSSLTSSQTLAYLGTMFLFLALLAAPAGAAWAPGPVRPALFAVALGPRIADLAKGVIDLSHAVFFLSLSALFVVLSALAIESRRWR